MNDPEIYKMDLSDGVYRLAEKPAPRYKRKGWLNLVLFFLTCLSTTFAGAFWSGKDPEFTIRFFLNGLPFSIPLILILGVHELGHYIASRLHGVDATFPFFIPVPTMIGTFGAFIKIKSAIPDRKSLFDIGFAGPFAGFLVALPVLFWGIKLSNIVPTEKIAESGLALGGSIIVSLVSRIVHGVLPAGTTLNLHHMGLAGWLGLWITSVNLLPIGQLDGGHISYAVFGEKSIWVSRVVWLFLLPIGILWNGWLFWALLIYVLIKLRHPPTIDPSYPLDSGRKKLALVALIIFLITFTPIPFS